MKSRRLNAALAGLLLACCFAAQAPAQSAGDHMGDAPLLVDAPLPQPADGGGAQDAARAPVDLRHTPVNILRDQEAIWTSPAHIRESNSLGPLLLVGTTALAVSTDHQVMSSSRLQDESLNDHAVTASNGLVGGFIALPAVMYGLGHLGKDEHAQETGVLGGEAILDGLGVNEVLKIVSRRERPTVDDARGKFFEPGVGFDSSFASNHSIIAWSSAAVVASEYEGPLTQITAYGLASGVSLTRVLGRQHFPSDVLVGSAVGWMIGRYVYHHHHRQY